MNPNTMPLQLTNIYKYCNTTSRTAIARGGISPNVSTCFNHNINNMNVINNINNNSNVNNAGLPLFKTSKFNTTTNRTNQSCRMAYAERMRTYSTTQESSFAFNKKTCTIGSNTFTY